LEPFNHIFYQKAVKHLNKDKPDLPPKLEVFNTKLRNHNHLVESLEKSVIPDLIHNKFRKPSPLVFDSAVTYQYDYNQVFSLIKDILNELMQNEANENDFKDFDINMLQSDEKDSALSIKGYSIGNGTDAERASMKSKIQEII